MALSSHRRIDSSMPGKETNPHTPLPPPPPPPVSSAFNHHPQAAVPANSALSFPLSAHPVGPTTHPSTPIFRPPTTPVEQSPLPSFLRHVPLPSDGQLSRYELTELRSFCGGRASSYAAYQLENVSAARLRRSPRFLRFRQPSSFPEVNRHPLIFEIPFLPCIYIFSIAYASNFDLRYDIVRCYMCYVFPFFFFFFFFLFVRVTRVRLIG